MKVLFYTLLSVVLSNAYAISLQNEDVTLTLDEMVRNNVISPIEAKKAKIRFNNVHKEFLSVTNRLPASVHTQLIDSNQTNDLSRAQTKQIEKEVQDIMGRSRLK